MNWIEFSAFAGISIVAWLIQRNLYALGEPSIRRVFGVLILSSSIMAIIGSVLFFAIYVATVPATITEAATRPLQAAVYFAKLGLMTAIIWLPILLFVAIDQARKVPNLK